jgi:hypothetical protein
MLYYILPPIIIVLGTAALIFFLFRKVSEFPDNEQLLRNNEKAGGFRERSSAIFGAIGQFILRVLERIMHRFKLLSLKFHNTSNDWFHTIRKKREESMNGQKKDERGENIFPQQGMDTTIGRTDDQREKEPRPLLREVSAGATAGRGRMAMRGRSNEVVRERKNQLEEVLIKRIAINPHDIEAYERLGDYYLEQANLNDSLECYKQVLRLSPMHYKAKAQIRKIDRMLR